jgi:hypothetical protein
MLNERRQVERAWSHSTVPILSCYERVLMKVQLLNPWRSLLALSKESLLIKRKRSRVYNFSRDSDIADKILHTMEASKMRLIKLVYVNSLSP